MNEGWIKIYRELTVWRWYTEPNAIRLYLHLLLKATTKELPYRDIVLSPGQYATSLTKLMSELNMSKQEVRTAIKQLVSTQEITQEVTHKYTVFSVQNWKKYQLSNTVSNTVSNTILTHSIEQEKRNNILPSPAPACACEGGEKSEVKEVKEDKEFKFDFNFEDLVRNTNLAAAEKNLFGEFIKNWEYYYGRGKKMTIFIASAQLERLIRLPKEDREEALKRAISQNWQNIHDIRRDANGRFIGNATKEKFDPYER